MRRIIFLFVFLLALAIVNAKLSIVEEQHTSESYNKRVALFEKLSSLLSSVIQNNNTNFETTVVSFRKLDRLNFTNQPHNSTSNSFLVEVTSGFCKGTIQLQSIDSNLNLVPFTQVFFNNTLNGTTDIFGLFESKQRSVCGEALYYTLKCKNNVTCETKTTTLDFHKDFDSLSFDCSVCTGDIDLRLDMSNIQAHKEDNKMTLNISMINVPATNDVNITFKVQSNDGLISREESQLFNITSNDRFKFIAQSISLAGNDFVHVYVDPDNEVTETNEKNNYALIPLFEKEVDAYLNISTGYDLVDNEIKDYLKLFVNEKPKDEADVTIAVGLPNKNTIINNKNSLTKKDYRWWFEDRIYYNNMPLGSKPYNGMVGAFSDDYNYIFVTGNDIDGLIAAVKRLVSARELFFSNLNKDKVSVIEDTDVAGISVTDLLRNPSNFPYYEKRGSIMFANVVERILNDNNFEVAIKTVKSTNDNTTLRLKNINTDFSDDFKDAIVGNTIPVVFSGGLFSNLFSWEENNGLAKQLVEEGRDTWEIEMTGGPNTECADCPNYQYEDLVDYYWPALIAGVEKYSGENTIQYVGHSNGCRVALDSLKNWSSSGKNDAGYYFDSSTGQYLLTDLASNPVDTFVGVGCPGVFNGSSRFIDKTKVYGDVAINSLSQRGFTHVTSKNYGVLTDSFAILMWPFGPKISLNVMSHYKGLAKTGKGKTPGEGTNINKVYLIAGNYSDLLSTGNDNDFLVPIQDIISINKSINYGNGELIIKKIRHDKMLDDKSIKEYIKSKLRGG